MDNLDKKLYKDLNLDVEVPDKLEIVIKNCLSKKSSYYLLPKIAILASCIIVTTSIVYAGSLVYDKVFKKPEKTIGFVSTDKTVTSENEKENIMTQEEAERNAKQILDKFGYKDEKIKLMELQDNAEDYELTWYIQTENDIIICLENKEEKSFSISVNNVIYEDIKKYRTTNEEAKQTAKKLCEQYGYNVDNYTYIKVKSNMISEKEAYIWSVDFYKEYDNIVNPYECISISFVPEINKIYGFAVNNEKCENNPVEISKEEAKQIALKEEGKIDIIYQIKDIDVNLKIVATNGIAYFRTNDNEQLLEQTNTSGYSHEKWTYYRTEKRIRKAWIVKITYDIPKDDRENYYSNNKQFSYFIDATTGEIIGGMIK